MLKLKIVSPEKVLYEGEATSVKVPGVLGGMEILQNHAPLISALTTGKVAYSNAEGTQEIQVAGGFVEVLHNDVSLCIERTSE
ncbi:MAG: ATP synthase F1 subunit epsilon [Prevotella sp.]|nr:ATP synthase F1 subunit epsilon [Prevotella sp.]